MDDRTADALVVIGDFEFDRRTGELRRGDATEPASRLGPQPAALLALLIDRHGAVVTHDEIRSQLWPAVAVDFEASLHHCIRQVRTALGERASDASYIETVPRRGYRLKVPPVFAAKVLDDTRVPPPPADTTKPIARSARPVLAIVIALGAAALAAGALSSTDIPEPTRVALLPFEDPKLDAATAAASSQLGERVLAQLTKRLGDTADVIGPRTTAPLRSQGLSLPEIAARLDAAYSLNAKFTDNAGRAELLVELIRSTDGKHVWVEYYEAPTQWQPAAPEIVAGVVAALDVPER